MMKQVFSFGKSIVVLGAFALVTFSCSKDEDQPQEEQQLSQTELKTILDNEDISGAVDTALADIYMNDGSTGKNANDCYSAEYSDTGFTAVFNNCTLNGTDNINGTLTVVYDQDGQSASFTATYADFFVGNIELDGTRTYIFDGNMDSNSYSFSVTSNMTATMADGSTISENGTKTFGFTFGDSLENTTFNISGDWTVNIDGNTYSVSVTQLLEGNLSCGYLNTGTMDISKNGLEVTVDFGDGTCDDIVTVIYPNGATEDISIKD